jgi:hypothetical protein
LTEPPTATPHKTRATKPTITTAKNVIISNSYQFLSHHKIYYTLIAAKVKDFLGVVFSQQFKRCLGWALVQQSTDAHAGVLAYVHAQFRQPHTSSRIVLVHGSLHT